MTPFDWILPRARPALFAALTVALAALSLALGAIGRPLVTAEAPRGILSFEFAGTNEAAARMVASWGPGAREAAHLSLGLDYLYLLVYPAWFSLGCLLVSARSTGPLGRIGIGMAWAIWVAGLLDAVENAALLALMGPEPAGGLAALAFGCAAPKFVLVGAAALFLVVGLLARRSGRTASR